MSSKKLLQSKKKFFNGKRKFFNGAGKSEQKTDSTAPFLGFKEQGNRMKERIERVREEWAKRQ